MKKVILLCLLFVFLTACSSDSDNDEISYHNYPDTSELITGIADHVVLPEENQPDLSDETTSGKADDGTAVTEAESNDWDYLDGFEGITSDYDTPVYANLGINVKIGSDISLVCPDPVSGAIYYVNSGEDDFIYKLENEQSTLVLDKKANYIQIWDNELYFLSDNISLKHLFNKVNPQSIYKYNLVTKELTLILDTNATWLFVNSDGIYYETSDEEILSEDSSRITVVGYHIAFDCDTPQRAGYGEYYPYNEYYLKLANNGNVLHNKNTGDEILVIPMSYKSYILNACIYEDVLYYLYGVKLYSLNLCSGKKKAYNIEDYENKQYDLFSGEKYKQYFKDYTIMNGEILILCNAHNIFRVDINTGIITKTVIEPEGGGIREELRDPNLIENPEVIPRTPTDYTFYKLYTSGDRLFAVGHDKDDEEMRGKMVELVVTSDSIMVKEIPD